VECGGYNPLDFYIANSGFNTAKYQFYDGANDATDGPGLTVGSEQNSIVVLRRGGGVAAEWSRATHNGTSWSTFTHTTSATTLAGGTYPTADLTFFNSLPLANSAALIGRCSSRISNTDIATLTTDLAAWLAVPTITNLDIQLVPSIAIPGMPAAVVAADSSQGATAIVGQQPNCYKWALPLPTPVKVVVSAAAGQGLAGAQVYEK
jgi:hypothetical protein